MLISIKSGGCDGDRVYLHAGHKIRVADELAGKTVRCPKCSERIAVPRIGRNPIEASTSDVQLVEPPARSSRKTRPADARAATGPAASTPSRSRDTGRQEPPPLAHKASASKRLWFLVAGFAAAALLLVTVGMFVALKFLAPKGAPQQSVAQNADAPGESPQKAGAAPKPVAADKRDAAAPAKAAPAIANATGEKPDAEDPTPAAAPQAHEVARLSRFPLPSNSSSWADRGTISSRRCPASSKWPSSTSRPRKSRSSSRSRMAIRCSPPARPSSSSSSAGRESSAVTT